MTKDYFDAPQLKEMFLAGANNLAANKEMVNNLNVFPVPDGDTGTNMSLTVTSACKELDNLEGPTCREFAKALSMGALMGARGNSGVILSQIFRGFSAVVGEVERVDKETLAEATEHAADIAYKAVIKPVEGTILTVIRSLAVAAREALDLDMGIEEMFGYMIRQGFRTLDKTPDMLPALKQANVVDAGGMGLLVILQGADAYLKGVTIEREETDEEERITDHAELREEDIIYPYCTELFIRGYNLNKEIIVHELSKLEGDSLVVIVQEDMAKIHMHTDEPGRILQYAITQGSLHDIKIENMREQFEAQQKSNPPERKPYGFLCVAAGDGLMEIARSMGVDYVVSGGQTMNPSTEDLVAGIREVHAETVYVLPNNKNIIMAAEQSSHLLPDVDVRVIPTRSFAQGMAAMIAFSPVDDHDANEANMRESIGNVVSAEVTYAVRDTEFEDHVIKEGAVLGLADGKIMNTGEDVNETTLDLIGAIDADPEIITLYYGEDVEQEQAEALADELQNRYQDAEIELYYGGQPLYYYLISIE